MDIKNPPKLNLYIKSMNKKTFTLRLSQIYQPRLDTIEMFGKDLENFKCQYNMDLNKVYPELFYLNAKNEWDLNTTGYARLLKDKDFVLEMVEAFTTDKYAYIRQQLSWLEKSDDFDEKNFIEDVIEIEDTQFIKDFLENAYNNNEQFTKEFFTESIMNLIDNNDYLKVIFNKIDNRKKRQKGMKQFNKLFEKCKLPYVVGSQRPMINRIRNTYWIILSTLDTN